MFKVACKVMNSFGEKFFTLIRPNLGFKLSLIARQ